jgi:hypothetical protein
MQSGLLNFEICIKTSRNLILLNKKDGRFLSRLFIQNALIV